MIEVLQLTQENRDLLEAVGCLTLASLAAKDPEFLHAELLKANKMLRLSRLQPVLSDVESWVSCAIAELQLEDEEFFIEPDESGKEAVKPARTAESVQSSSSSYEYELVDVESSTGVAQLLRQAPVAERLNSRLIREQQLAVSDIPAALLLRDCDGRVEINTGKQNVPLAQLIVKMEALAGGSQKVGLVKPAVDTFHEPIESAQFQDFDVVNNGELVIEPLEATESEIATASPGLNKKVKPGSRRYIRGVLHSSPFYIKAPAFSLLAALVSLLGIPFVFIADLSESRVTVLLVVLFSFFMINLIIFFIFLGGSSCPVCGQKQFVPKQCIKHKNAHRFPLLGRMIPTALQAIIYHWFYCIYCGTAIRLKR